MSDITAYERRVSAALERIARKVERMQHGGVQGDGESTQKLRDALEKERIANAQLSERVHQVKQRQETTIAQLERRLARLTEQLDLQSLEMLRLKKANTRLIDANTALRQAHIEGFPDSTLINRSISAELEALQAERRSEMAEMEEILAELKPLLAAENRSA